MSEQMSAYPEADCDVSGVETPEFREAGGILGRTAPQHPEGPLDSPHPPVVDIYRSDIPIRYIDLR